MPKSPTKTRPKTVTALMRSALALFVEHGFHATSISDICGHAGLTRGAFYSNYRTKEQLFLALYDVEADRVLADIEQAVDTVTPGDDPVRHIIDRVGAHRRENHRWFLVSMEFTLHAARTPDLAAELAPHEDRLTTGLAALLERSLPGLSRDRAEDVARLLTALHEGTTAQELIHGTAATAFRDRLLSDIVDALVADNPR
ncbi:TetR/AcrR family transcriptional regulator [Actinosynnema sp. NPDC050436]|uniref:TetR/AcrR family transcriptional regulator n=1 Tax=Actinosynnema sp. NPDC050436 TaxID=3155659 RepID=UPI00340224B8